MRLFILRGCADLSELVLWCLHQLMRRAIATLHVFSGRFDGYPFNSLLDYDLPMRCATPVAETECCRQVSWLGNI
jgi:hypothetical protein